MIRALPILLLLAGCSDPLDDEPRGQEIPTESVRVTIYAPGSGGGGGGMAGGAGAAAGDPSGGASMPTAGGAGGQAGAAGVAPTAMDAGAARATGGGRSATVQPSAPQPQSHTPISGQAGQRTGSGQQMSGGSGQQ